MEIHRGRKGISMKSDALKFGVCGLITVLAGCQGGPASAPPPDGADSISPARAALVSPTGTYAAPSPTTAGTSAASTFSPQQAIVAESADFTISRALQTYSITDSQKTPVKAAKALAGYFKVRGPNASRDFSGSIGLSPDPEGQGTSGETELGMNSGWAYFELEAGYAPPAGTAGRYRPIVRTKRTIAMSEGTSMLIFNDSDPTTGLGNNTEEFIVNPASGRGVITVTTNNARVFTLNPGQYIVLSGGTNNPTVGSVSNLDSTTPAPPPKLTKLMNYASKAVKTTLGTDITP
jgi:hypothetical protein